jgi:hypothetical protein
VRLIGRWLNSRGGHFQRERHIDAQAGMTVEYRKTMVVTVERGEALAGIA